MYFRIDILHAGGMIEFLRLRGSANINRIYIHIFSIKESELCEKSRYNRFTIVIYRL